MIKQLKTLQDLIINSENPGNGREIPWSDPDFSRRILREQLNLENDIASRRPVAIDKQVRFIHNQLLAAKKTAILDLGCGPGLYAHRLAELGHSCTGIDISPAAIDYALQTAKAKSLNCKFIRADFLTTDLGNDYGLAMLTFGDFNAFPRKTGKLLIKKIFDSLQPGGLFLLEGLTIDGVRDIGEREPGWLAFESGMFSDEPYLYLDRYSYDAADNSAAAHYFIVNAGGQVEHFQQNYRGYSDDDYLQLLLNAGFEDVEFYPGFAPGSHDFADDLQMIAARKS